MSIKLQMYGIGIVFILAIGCLTGVSLYLTNLRSSSQLILPTMWLEESGLKTRMDQNLKHRITILSVGAVLQRTNPSVTAATEMPDSKTGRIELPLH